MVCFLSPLGLRECVPDTIGFVNKQTKFAAYCGKRRETMQIQDNGWSNKHTIHFEATDKNHRYIIKTHGCGGNSKCIAAWKKDKSDLSVFHKMNDNSFDDTKFSMVWHFDYHSFDVNNPERHFYYIRPDDGTQRGWYSSVQGTTLKIQTSLDDKTLWYFIDSE